MPNLRDPLGARLFGEWEKSGRTRLGQDILWSGFEAVDAMAGRFGNETTREVLMRLLRSLEAAERVVLPVQGGDGWDRTAMPPVPRWVTLQRPKLVEKPSRWRNWVFHDLLLPVRRGLRVLSPAQETFLLNLDMSLKRGDLSVACGKRSRSLRLTGDEKALDAGFLGAAAFLELDQSLLNCVDYPVPICLAHLEGGRDILIVENAEPFYVALEAARLNSGSFGGIAFGGGNAISDSMLSLRWLAPGPRNVTYLGDLDRSGMEILRRVREVGPKIGVQVSPANGLYREMFRLAKELGEPLGWPAGTANQKCHTPDETLLSVMDEDLRPMVSAMWAADRRIPEEILGVADFSAMLAPSIKQTAVRLLLSLVR